MRPHWRRRSRTTTTWAASDTTLTFTPLGQTTPLSFGQQEKAIIEGFDLDYGRMNAQLGGTLPNLGPQVGTASPYDYVDPPTDVATNTIPGTMIGALNDGTQIWRIDHQGVDTHAIHFHLFNVQLINRIAIDGQLFPPDPNELGWKETIRMNPGVDTIVAMQAGGTDASVQAAGQHPSARSGAAGGRDLHGLAGHRADEHDDQLRLGVRVALPPSRP